MSNDPEIQAGKNTAQRGTSLNRRRLLKAAASSAPIIATLPSGAAMANASTSQCILKDFNDTHAEEQLGMRLESLGPDQYLREVIPMGSATNGTNTVLPAFLIGGTIYDADGNSYDNTYQFTQVTTVLAARVFVPYDDISNGIDPETPTDVEQAVPGIWPANQLADDSHMALTGSCLCSINPDLA